MALPETPQTREEAYLNAVATGDTSGLPSAPQTREEQYLDYIAKNGGGGSGGGGVLVVTVTDQEVTVAGTTTTIRVCDKTAAEIFEAAQKGPVWFCYPVTQTSHDITMYAYPWFYLEVAMLTNKYEFHTSSSNNMSFVFKASNGSDYPATTPTV